MVNIVLEFIRVRIVRGFRRDCEESSAYFFKLHQKRTQNQNERRSAGNLDPYLLAAAVAGTGNSGCDDEIELLTDEIRLYHETHSSCSDFDSDYEIGE